MNKSSLKRGNEIEKEITELQNEIGKLSRYNKISKRLNIINRSVRLNIDLSCYSNKFISDLILTEEDALKAKKEYGNLFSYLFSYFGG